MGLVSGAVLGAAQGLVLAWDAAMPVLFGLGWSAATAIAVSVEEQFTVFGAAGAILFALLSGLLFARVAPGRTRVA